MRQKLFYGWYLVAASLVLIILEGLLLYSFGVLLPYLNKEFGFSLTEGSSLFSFRSVVLAFSLVAAGRLVDKYDPRIVVFSGGLIAVLGVCLTGLATEGWHLYLTYGFLIGLGQGVLYITCVALVSRWFIKKRTLAIGIITTGIPISGLIANPLTAWLISSFGVRNALFALSGIILASIGSAFVLRAYPEDKGLKPYGADEESTGESSQNGSNNNDWRAREAIATQSFWLLYLMYFFAFTTFLIVVVHLFNFAIDLGIPPLVASGAPAAIGFGSLFGRVILSAFLTEIIEKKKVLFLCFLLQGSSIFILLASRETWAFYLFGVLFGFFYSGTVPIFPTLLGNFFGLTALGTIYGFFGSSYSLAAIAGPLSAGRIHDATGSYFYPFLLAVFFCYIASILSFFIKTPVKKIAGDRGTVGPV